MWRLLVVVCVFVIVALFNMCIDCWCLLFVACCVCRVLCGCVCVVVCCMLCVRDVIGVYCFCCGYCCVLLHLLLFDVVGCVLLCA